jgi:hypothetical protein
MSEGDVTEGSDSDATRLEQRARNLLRVYPPGYRADRGEEIIGTLLEATPPGRNWPPARDISSLAVGGIRARRHANQRAGVAASLRQAAILGITLYLLGLMLNMLARYLTPVFSLGPEPEPDDWRLLLAFFLLATALAGAWSGRRRLTVASAAAGGAAGVCSWPGWFQPAWTEPGWTRTAALGQYATVPLLSLAALVLLTRSGERLPKSWRWVPAAAAAVATLVVLTDWLRIAPAQSALRWLGNGTFTMPWTYTSLNALAITFTLCACWAATDVRPLAGLALGFELAGFGLVSRSVYGPIEYNPLQLSLTATTVTIPLAIVFALALLLRRRLRTSPSATG